MNKFIAAFDGLKYSMSTRDYALELARKSEAHLVGVFLEDFTYHSYKIHDLIQEEGGVSEARQKILDDKDAVTRAAAVQNFENACRKAGLSYTIHHNRNIAVKELLHESIYADLLIIDNTETLTHYIEKPPTRFIHDLLPHVQCPVLLVPHKNRSINKIILLYDGEPSSMHALKMFSYVLASLKENPTEAINVKSENQSLHLPDNRLVKEFMKRHFPKTSYTILKGSPEKEIVSCLKKEPPGSLVVLGAYRRSMVSRWFRPSMADTLLKYLKLPLFIAHQ